MGHVKSAHADEEAAMPCSVCSVIFTDRDRLFEHLEKHVLDGSESAGVFYECCVCRLKFSEMAALDVHIKLHRVRSDFCVTYCCFFVVLLACMSKIFSDPPSDVSSVSPSL